MKRRNQIIASCLIVFYMLSMAHSLFHNHLHGLLAHAVTIEHTDHSACGDCCCSENNIDHKHSTNGESKCNLQTQFVPTDQKPKIEVHSIDIHNSSFILPSIVGVEVSQCEELEYRAYSYILPPDPEIRYHSLRAPPAQC